MTGLRWRLPPASGGEFVGPHSHSIEEAVARLYFYAALYGHDSWWKVAGHAVECAYSRGLPPDVVRPQAAGAVAWLMVAAGKRNPPLDWKRQTATSFMAAVQRRPGAEPDMIERMLHNRASLFECSDSSASRAATRTEASSVCETTAELAQPAVRSSPPQPDNCRATICTEARGGRSEVDFGQGPELLAPDGRSMRLVPVPDLAQVQHQLLAAFPHAAPVISAMLDALSGSPYVTLPPIVFVGPPGAGKTAFAEMLAHVLNIPCEICSCAGRGAGGTFIGRPSHNITGQSSLPAWVTRRHHHASPLIVLDDIDRIDASLPLETVLPGLFEAQTAATSNGPGLGLSVGLPHMIWIGTATSWKAIPAPLQDRFQFIGFPAPRREHLDMLVPQSLERLATEQGMDCRWAASLSRSEMKFVWKNWKTKSLRHLSQLLEAVLAARENLRSAH